jgi:hypothetical protein
MSQADDAKPAHTGKKRRVELPNGRLATVELTSDRDYMARLDVSLGNRRWVFGVQNDHTAEYLQAFEDGDRRRLDLPDWIAHIEAATELEGIHE